MNLLKHRNGNCNPNPFKALPTAIVNLGDKIDYNQRKNDNLGELIQETLE